MRVLVCGSRDWPEGDTIRMRLRNLLLEHGRFLVMHGDCPTGADAFADHAALVLGLDSDRYPADWKAHGRAAGPIRSKWMVGQLDPSTDRVLAFQRDGSRGTQHTIDEARKRGIPVEVHVA